MDNFQEVPITADYDNKAFAPSIPETKPPESSSSSKEPSSSSPSTTNQLADSTVKTPISTVSTPANDLPNVEVVPGSIPLETQQSGIHRNRPFSASVISRNSTYSTRSKVSISPSIHLGENAKKNFYSNKDGSLSKAIEDCRNGIVPIRNESFVGAWLLTQVNTWNMHFEKLMLLTDQTLYMVKYNFIARKPVSYRFVSLKDITKLQISDLTFPPISITRKKNEGAIRIYSGPEPNLFERWNPYSFQTNVLTFTHHPVIYALDESETVTFNADDFAESLLTQVTKLCKNTDKEVVVDESPVMVYTYVGLLSMIHNESRLGFNLDRNGLSW